MYSAERSAITGMETSSSCCLYALFCFQQVLLLPIAAFVHA